MTDYDTSRGPWHAMIDRQALARQAQTGETYEKAYTECYCDPRNATIVNELKYEHLAKSHDAIFGTAKSLVKTQKAAPAYDPLAKAAEHAELLGPNHARMHSLAVDHQRAVAGTYQQAYAHVYSRRENEQLRNAVKAEHMSHTMSGLSQEVGKAAPADPKQDYVTPGAARAELHALTAARMRRDPTLSYERAFTQEYLHEDNRRLKQRVDEESVLHAQRLSPAPAFPAYTAPGHRGDPSNRGTSGQKPKGYAGG